MGTLKMKQIAVIVVATLASSGCANWGGYAGGAAGGGLSYAAANAMNASPTVRGIITAGGMIVGAKLGEKAVFKAGLKPLSPAVANNMTNLTDEARDAFKRSMNATQAADDAEMLYRTSPNDVGAHNKLHEAARVEVSAWNNYARHREQLVVAVNTAQHQGFEVEKYHDQTAELLNMEVPVFDKVAKRRS